MDMKLEVQSVKVSVSQCGSVSFLSVHISLHWNILNIIYDLKPFYEGTRSRLFGVLLHVPRGGGVQLILEKVEEAGREKQYRHQYEEQLCELLGDQ